MLKPLVGSISALALLFSVTACGDDNNDSSGSQESSESASESAVEVVDGAQTCEDPTDDGHAVDLSSATFARADDGTVTVTYETVAPLPAEGAIRLDVIAWDTELANSWFYSFEVRDGEQSNFSISDGKTQEFTEVKGKLTISGTTVEGEFPAATVDKAKAPDNFTWTARAAYFPPEGSMDEDACSLGESDDDSGNVDMHLVYEG